MLSPELKKSLASIGMFIMPLALVKISAEIMSGPRQGAADVAEEAPAEGAAPAIVPAAAPAVTAAQLAAARRIEELRAQMFGSTPFYYEPQSAAPAPEPIEPEPTQPSPAPGPDMPTYRLQAIMHSSSGTRALIDSRPYREGDRLPTNAGGQWIVQSIDQPNRMVTLIELQTGRSIKLSVNLPQFQRLPAE